MTTAASNVAVGRPDKSVSGGILRAPLGTDRPTRFDGPFDEAYVSQGYVSEDGVTETAERSTEVIREWGGQQVRVVQTEYNGSLSFTLIESRRADVLKTVFGEENVDVQADQIVVKRNDKSLEHAQYLIALLDEGKSRLLEIPDGQITEVGDITYVSGEAISYEVTLSLYPDENGDTLIEYIETGESGS